ncbi:MAG TPA: type II secretion system minor pseudopilin GspK [Guyparkeria sp.]|nr:type II secretion system minor pseudopilin GspK [Guyparkeria sp.]
MSRTDAHQQGVALIVALLVLAIASGLAVSMIAQNQRAIDATAIAFQGAQADRLAEGALALAQIALESDAPEVDSPADEWATPIKGLPVESGQIDLQIVDLQGRLNLNNLITAEGKLDPLAQERLTRLLTHLNIPSERAGAIADWIDPDQLLSTNGAEDGSYLSRNPPYRTADLPLRSVSELRAIAGLTATEYDRLAPHVTALPRGTALNLNTATPAALVAIGAAESAEQATEREPAGSVSQALAQPLYRDRSIDPARLAVNSHYFLCSVTVRLDRSTRYRHAVIERRNDGSTHIIAMSNRPCLSGHYCI